MNPKAQNLLGGFIGFVTMVALLGRFGSRGYMAALFVIALGVLYQVPKIVSRDPTRGSIQRWHGGQLILFSIGVLFAGWLCLIILDEIDHPMVEHPVVTGLLIGGLVAVPASLFAAAWIWFAGRGRPTPPPQP